jgi:hypothetical protein
MPRKTLDRDLVEAIRQITDRYINSREGTPAHLIKTKLDKKRDLLEEAVRDEYLRYTGPEYFPRFLALNFEDSHTRGSVYGCITQVFKALRAIYERDGDRMCTQDSILEMCKTFDPTTSPEAVKVGMLFATDFPHYVHLWNVTPDSRSLILAASDRLIDFDDLASAWKQELRDKRNKADAALRAATPASAPSRARSTSLVFETLSETYTSEGTEGEGGSAKVFRAVDAGGKRWALKCLKSEQANTTRTKRFLNELMFCRDSSYPNVVPVVDHGFVLQEGRKCPST